MSFSYTKAAWGITPSLNSAAEALVLLFLADCANDDGVCCPPVAVIAKCTRLNRKTVVKAVKALAANSTINCISQSGERNRYELNFVPSEMGSRGRL